MVSGDSFLRLRLSTREGDRVAQSKANLPSNENAELDTLLFRARQARGDVGEALVDGAGFDVVTVPLSSDQI
jgi:hypothetical protein